MKFHRITITTVAISLCFVLSTCSISTDLDRRTVDDEQPIIILSEEQNGGLVALKIGDSVSVEVDGIPSTGFTWEIDNLDESLLLQQGEIEITQESDRLGGISKYRIFFKAVNSGTGVLRLIYHRPFEKDQPPERVYEIAFDIQ